MIEGLEIREAEPSDASAIAEIHLTARRAAMAYLHRRHTDETREYFCRAVSKSNSWGTRVILPNFWNGTQENDKPTNVCFQSLNGPVADIA